MPTASTTSTQSRMLNRNDCSACSNNRSFLRHADDSFCPADEANKGLSHTHANTVLANITNTANNICTVECHIQNNTFNHVKGKGKENKENSGQKQTFDKIMDPLSSTRLRPIRQKTRNAVVSILNDGTVSLEFIQCRSGVEYVVEGLRISPDGIKVTITTPNEKNGVPLQESPVPISPSSVSHAFSALPPKFWKKYQYADKFVRLVKMKTPKVCQLFCTYFALRSST